jgi:hypothetical protein
MITKQKIEIYRKFQGDSDGFSRSSLTKEKDLFQKNDWSLIDSVVQDLELVKNGLCSEEYKNLLDKTLEDNFDTTAIELIKKMI